MIHVIHLTVSKLYQENIGIFLRILNLKGFNSVCGLLRKLSLVFNTAVWILTGTQPSFLFQS
jgi:hypothetical protein